MISLILNKRWEPAIYYVDASWIAIIVVLSIGSHLELSLKWIIFANFLLCQLLFVEAWLRPLEWLVLLADRFKKHR